MKPKDNQNYEYNKDKAIDIFQKINKIGLLII